MDLSREGYRLRWGPNGLIVQVLDYHVKPLGIPWSLSRQLADAAEKEPQADGPLPP